MATSGRSRSLITPPEKGAFPLDHFKECSSIIDNYMNCIAKHDLMPKRCQKIQVEYLNCRMENGLMSKEPMENLGFTKQNTYETEMEQNIALYKLYAGIQAEAKRDVDEWLKHNQHNNDNNYNKNINKYK